MTEWDYEEIRQLLARHSQALDFGDVEGFVGCYTSEGTLTTDSPEEGLRGSHSGAEELRAYAHIYLEHAGGHLRQSVVNTLIGGDESSARALSYVIVSRDFGRPILAGETTHSTLVTTGLVSDDLVKVDGRWLFARREFSQDGRPEVMGRVGRPVVLGAKPLG
jgi:hypothetical protein